MRRYEISAKQEGGEPKVMGHVDADNAIDAGTRIDEFDGEIANGWHICKIEEIVA